MDRPGPAAIGHAGMLELLQLHAKGVIELSHGAREHDVSPPRVLVDNGETVLIGELFDSLDVRRVRLRTAGRTPRGSGGARICRRRRFFGPFPVMLFMLTVAQNQGDLQPFTRIGPSDRSCSRQWFPLATDERIIWHSSTLLNLCGICRAGSANGSATARSGSRTEFEISVAVVCQAGIKKRPNELTIP